MYNKLYSTDKFTFGETPFHNLMQKRIYDVLLICSKYEKFLLEEDGRIDEQIFQEYVSLNLRYPPVFTTVSTSDEAFASIKENHYDLVISMWNTGDSDSFEIAKEYNALATTHLWK